MTEEEGTTLMDVMDEVYDELYQKQEKEYVKKVCSTRDKKPSLELMFINPVMIPEGKTIEKTLLEIQKKKEKERFHKIYEQLKRDGKI